MHSTSTVYCHDKLGTGARLVYAVWQSMHRTSTVNRDDKLGLGACLVNAVRQCMHRTSTVDCDDSANTESYGDDSANTESRRVYAVWRASHNLQQYHSVLLGSYILVTGHSFIHLQKIKDFKVDTNRLPVFITMVSSCQARPVLFLTVYGVLWMYTALCHRRHTVNVCAVASSC